MKLADHRLGADFNKKEAMVMIKVALVCTNAFPVLRPAKSSVVSMLEGRTAVQEVVPDKVEALDEKLEAMRQYYQTIENKDGSISIVETSAFMSSTDIHANDLDSSYSGKRDLENL